MSQNQELIRSVLSLQAPKLKYCLVMEPLARHESLNVHRLPPPCKRTSLPLLAAQGLIHSPHPLFQRLLPVLGQGIEKFLLKYLYPQVGTQGGMQLQLNPCNSI